MNGQHFTELYRDLSMMGNLITIKESECIEYIDYTMIIDDPRDCLTSFTHRNLNLQYCKKEWL